MTRPLDVLVVGGGLAGMTAARQLARLGRRVRLVEHHYKLGGLATWFKRPGGQLFDVSRHGFPYGMVRALRRYWSPELASRVVPVERLVFRNPQFALETRYDQADCARHMRETFELPPEAVEAFFAAIPGADLETDPRETTREFFGRFFPGRDDVARFLMEPITIANGTGLDDPALTFRIVFGHFMRRGIHVYGGRTDEMIQAMRRLLEEDGVEVRTRTRVEGVELEDGRVVGVRVAGELVRARCVVSNAGLRDTVLHLLPADALDPALRRAAEEVRSATSSCLVFFGLKPGASLPNLGDALFLSDAPRYASEAMAARDVRTRVWSLHEGKPAAVTALSNARWEDWCDLDDSAYEVAKAELVAGARAAMARDLPELVDLVESAEAATPRTIRRYTREPWGASYGTRFEGLRVSRELLPAQVPGLFHAGSVGVVMSGWVGAVNYGAITAARADAYLGRAVR